MCTEEQVKSPLDMFNKTVLAVKRQYQRLLVEMKNVTGLVTGELGLNSSRPMSGNTYKS